MPGIQITSLQDLLMLRELKNQSNPTYTAMKALSDGVAMGISEKQEAAKTKKKQEDAFAKAQEVANTNSSKITTKIDEEGNQSYSIISGSENNNSTIIDPKKFEITGYTSEGKAKYGKKISNIDDLSSDEQIKARALARRLYGVRGARDGLPTIVAAMSEGKTIDDIEDSVRFASQSTEFSGPVRDAAQSVYINTPSSISDKAMDFIDDEVSKGNVAGVRDKLKKAARDTAGTAAKGQAVGKERTVEFLEEIQGDLNSIEQLGIDTNIFTGTIEDIQKRIGRVQNPEVRKIATKIQVAIQNYRRSMSGVAFSVPESAEYKDMFPGIGRTQNFNRANIEALSEVMKGDLENFYSLSMGSGNYQKIFKGQSENTQGGSVPEVGGTFNGQKVISVQRIN